MASFFVYDGNYHEKWYNFNVTFKLPEDENNLFIECKNITVDFIYGENFERLSEGSKF